MFNGVSTTPFGDVFERGRGGGTWGWKGSVMTQISEQRREQIVQTARSIVDRQGPSHLTADAITREIGVSRPLLYHYFENMGDLLDAVMCLYLAEFEERLTVWEDNRRADSPSDEQRWALELERLLRPSLVEECPLRIDAVQGYASSCYGAFISRCAETLSAHIERDPSGVWGPCAQLPCLHEAVRFALYGFTGTLAGFPAISDEDASQLLARTLGVADGRMQAVPAEDAVEAREPEQPPEQTGRKGLFGWIFS